MIILAFCLFCVSNTINSRKEYKNQAINDVAKRCAMAQVIKAPQLVLNSKTKDVQDTLNTIEQKFDIDVKTSFEKENIFQIPIYVANVKTEGKIDTLGRKNLSGIFKIDVSDFKGFVDMPKVYIEGTEIFPDSDGVYHVNISPKSNLLNYAVEYQLRGTQQISISISNVATKLRLVTNHTNPDFIGDFSPYNTEYLKDSFVGEWSVSKIAATGQGYRIFGVAFTNSVDNYRMVERCIKYGFLFIFLTYITFFVFEVKNRQYRIHPFQYGLIGVSLIIFYLLLLSLSEFYGFLLSYALAAFMTIALISGYSYFVVTKKQDKNFSILVAVFLFLIYLYLYMTVNMEQYALICGSFGLFFAILAIMYATRNVQWYSDKE